MEYQKLIVPKEILLRKLMRDTVKDVAQSDVLFPAVEIYESPWQVVFKDASGKLLTRTISKQDDAGTFTPLMPFCFVRRSADYSTSMAPVFALSPDEKIFGCGESFTSFDKRGQKVVLFTDDANGTQNESMYKPIPFFMSSRGYGVFMHTSTPVTCDFGKYFRECNMLMMGDDVADLFVFLGEPRDILDEYTELTGEAAPLNGIYASGRTGFYEHNLYPLRYNKTVADITRKINGETIIWARSTWAGSQRYPLHWGGDAANTNTAMASSLRSGLSIGICGFFFWAHDIGGFVLKAPEDIYRRWTPFGMLSSHTRSHGAPPTEPWEYSQDFLNMFRLAAEMRYKLMPYIYAQAKDCTEHGIPMLRALFIDYPGDPGSWLIDNQYLFGSDMLVAPLFENVTERDVYLPPGQWIDYQTGESYASGWHKIKAGELPVVVLVKEGTVIPHIELAQSTSQMHWSKQNLVAFTAGTNEASGLVCLPSDQKLHVIVLDKKFNLIDDPYHGKVDFTVKKI